MSSHVRNLCRTYVVWRAGLMTVPEAEFMIHIYLKISFKHITEYHAIYYNKEFLFPCLKILLGHSNRWTLRNRHEPSCGVCSSWEGRDILAVSSLPFPSLWWSPNNFGDPNVKRLVATCHSFWFIVFFCCTLYRNSRVIHYCCMDAVAWKRQEVGLKRACRVSVVGIRGILRSKSVEELSRVPTGTRTYAPLEIQLHF
jgi:hypothetical protein